VTSYNTAFTKLAKMTVVMTLRKSPGRYRTSGSFFLSGLWGDFLRERY
jgi:hypothetical protein